MSDAITAEQRHQINFLIGPWLIGTCLELLLQGILCSQFSNYYSYYSDDHTGIRVAVGVLALITVLKSIQSFALIWIQNIVFFGDLQGAILLNYTTWWQSGNPLMVAVIGFYVQCYFCWRLWVISRNWFVVIPVAAIFIFALLSIVVATYFITIADGPQIGKWFASHLSSVFAGDMILCLTTAYFLLKSRRSVLPQTMGLINALLKLAFLTALPAALCAMFNLIFSQVFHDEALVSTAFNMMLPKLWAISMMWTLNARRTIRALHTSRTGMTGGTSNEVSGGRSRVQRRIVRVHVLPFEIMFIHVFGQGDVELGAIQVLTQTETTQHIDVRCPSPASPSERMLTGLMIQVRDMFDPTQGSDVKHTSGSHGQKSDDESVKYSK
ncbi:hypothetical protein B0H15DRAFT_770813 [Mycena belliarum]|uniref:DUF6534 domain-containing protein n=1 Tax=Mycena belliarum TaxID=1033014 RepID=A0AAD6UDM7_9AGAR|nr:hypothetical protein B0H15DRAFT_770813 [Mycena belliae]